MSDEIVDGIGGARVIGKTSQDFAFSLVIHATAPICPVFWSVNPQDKKVPLH